MEILVVDSMASIVETQRIVQSILALPFPKPVDFVFDYINLRLAIALDFESHPQLVEYLQTIPHQHPLQAVGGRLGRSTSGQLATSEWSGRYGDGWNDQNRQCFKQSMAAMGMPIAHQVWNQSQTANQVG